MRRRDFITFLSGATTWAVAARAQEPRRVIGVLGGASYGALLGTEAAFIEGLRAAGFVEGKNISMEWRWAEGQYDRCHRWRANWSAAMWLCLSPLMPQRRLRQRR